VTYHGIDELATPYLKILLISDVSIWEQFEEVEDNDLGFVEERSHLGR
jgi:hypothetical protein